MRFAIESWIWYSFAVGIIVARLTSRTLLFGSPKGLQYDDWIMGLFITSCYTVLIVMSNIEARAQSNLLPPGFDVNVLTVEDIRDREYGSKIVVVVEQMQIAVIWACKSCLLILYYRLTESVAPTHHRAIRLLAAYVAFGFVVMEILYFAAWCRPFSQYYAVPTKSSQCNALINHRITNAVFNISSDLLMLCIALPLFIRSLLPLKRKLILCGIFSLGIFAIIAAALNKYYSFTAPYEPTWIFWYVREASTAILVANLPFTWTLLRKLFNLGAFDEDHPPPPTYHSSRTAGGRRTARAHQTHHTHQTHRSNSHADEKNSASKGSTSKSLIGSICETRPHHAPSSNIHTNLTDNTQSSDHGLLDQAIQPHDFAPGMPADPIDITIEADEEIDLDIDIEQALHYPSSSPGQGQHLSPPHHHNHQHTPRPTSPSPSRPRLSFDGTGGYTYTNAPHRKNIPHNAGAGASRASSVASVTRRPISPEDTNISSSSPPRGAGGGRSATDRRKRARLSR